MKTKAIMHSRYIVMLVVFIMLFAACRKTAENANGTAPGPDPLPSAGGVITPQGIPDGSPASEKVIGKAGGFIVSHDGMLRVDVPAGALENDESFSIQRISNTNINKRDAAYRILPHTKTLRKNAKLTMHYSEAAVPEALAVAYQHENGVWMAPPVFTLDKNSKAISLETDHFSDWSIFTYLYLIPEQTMMAPAQSIPLEVYLDEGMLAPLDGSTRPTGLPTKNIGRYIKKWYLEGPGELNVQAEKAWYHAPESVVGPATAVVRVEIDLGKKFVILYCYITVLNSGITVEVPGRPDHLIEGNANFLGNNIIVINGGDQQTGKNQLVLTWTGGRGSYFWNDGSTQFLYTPAGNEVYTHFYRMDDLDVPSGGHLTVTDVGENDGYVKGSFILDPAGFGQMGSPTHRFGTIKGSFRVPKKKR